MFVRLHPSLTRVTQADRAVAVEMLVKEAGAGVVVVAAVAPAFATVAAAAVAAV